MKRITKKRWFGPKYVGYGISPRSWEGWLVILVWAVLFILSGYYLQSIDLLSNTAILITYIALPIIALIIIMALTYGSED